MNIFYVDKCPITAAQIQCDKHVVKMTLESAQMLSTVHHLAGSSEDVLSNIYKPTHAKHPSTLWAYESAANYDWLCLHGMALAHEWSYRFHRADNSHHASKRVIWYCMFNRPNLRGDTLTPMPQCMPDEYKAECSVEAYRHFYNVDKRYNMTCEWTRRQEPDWWRGYEPFLHS